jgi:hypothetical protein
MPTTPEINPAPTPSSKMIQVMQPPGEPRTGTRAFSLTHRIRTG